MNKNSLRILVVAIMAATLSTAFAVGQPGATSVVQSVQATDATERGDDNQQEKESTHENEHAPSFAANGNLDETKVTELRIALHDLWIEHIVWTRQYIVAAAADGADSSFAAERLLENQDQIGDAIKPFYGDEAGDQLTALLKDHILIAVDLLQAAKAGDSAAVAEIEERWYDNGDDIATFLSQANPNWNKEDMLSMINEHLALTKTEAVARLTADYATDVENFDALYVHAVSMADAFTDGIVKQFEEQFEANRSGEKGN